MTGSVNQIDLMIFPVGGHSCRNNGNTTLALLLHPVRHCGAFIHIAEAIGATGIEQNPLSRRGLTGINMRDNTNIAASF